MSVRFVIGRAGAGKTAHCIRAIAESLRDDPLDGPHLLLLVPEQAGLQMERRLLSQPGITVVHRAEVVGFRRLAHRILATCPRGEVSALSPAARAMILRLLLARLAPELRYYRRPERFSGVIEHLGRTISELIEESISPDDIATSGAGPDVDPMRAAKLHDLGHLYKAYLDHLGVRRLDPSQFLDAARKRIPKCDWLCGAQVWVDGFAGFTQQERLTLAGLASVAEHMVITALMDPNEYSGIRRGKHPEATDLFATTHRMVATVSGVLADHGVPLDEPVAMRGPSYRFSRSPALASLERNLFGSASFDAPSPSGQIRLIEACDRRTEVEYAVSQVVHYVQRPNEPLRYRDIALIVRDLQPYDALISAALQSRGIPYFIDRRRPTAHHPLVTFVRVLFELAATDYAIAPVRQLLKTGLLDLSDEQADQLENYLLATGVAGRDKWRADDWSAPRRNADREASSAQVTMANVNDARKRFAELVDPWVAKIAETPRASGREWAERIIDVLRRGNVEDRVEQWARHADGEGDLDLGESHRQTWRDCAALIDDLEDALGDALLDADNLLSIIDSALGQLTLGLAPPMLDQVLVGSIERSRHPEIKVAILLGFNEGLFPAIPVESPVLNDDDRAWLAEQGVSIGTPRTQRVLEERMLAYVAMTRAGEAVLVSYAAADENGKELHPSPYVKEIMSATGITEPQRVGDPFRTRQDWAILGSRDLATHLAFEFRHRTAALDDETDRDVRALWNSLYSYARADRELTPTLRRALEALTYENDASLTSRSVELLISRPYRASVSQLESHAACPFKHFAQYGLKLGERPHFRLDELDVGTVHHAILERFYGDLHERGTSIVELDDSGVDKHLGESLRRVGETLPLLGQLSHARDRYVVARAREELGRVLSAQKRIASAGEFRSRATELPFGMADRHGLDALEIATPKGRRVLLRGIIDRVDLAEVADEMLGIVVDYKRTREKRLDLSQAYYGLSLQLLGYLLVLAERGQSLAGRPIKPTGAFYVTLRNEYSKVDHPADVKDAAAGLRPRGVVSTAGLSVLDRNSGQSGWSSNYPVFRKKDGSIGRVDQSDAADPEPFAHLLDHTRGQLGVLADGVLDGVIDVSPYRLQRFSPCSWCRFGSVCRVEPAHTRFRFLESLKRSEVFRRVSDASGGPE